MEYCSVCMTRKDVWDEGQEKNDIALNNAEKKPEKDLSKVPEHLREHVIKPGEVRNPHGRPKGSKNLTTIVMDLLRAKTYTVKNDANSQTTEITGEQAFAEAILENAIKKKDRESLRMIWEMADGKPTQQHRLDIHSPKGYQVDPEQEKVITEQFGMYDDQIPMLATPLIAPQTIKEVETVQTTEPEQNTPPTPQNTPNQGVQEPPITYDNTQQNNTGVRENTEGQTGGVREA
jgi:hypothetical protein